MIGDYLADILGIAIALFWVLAWLETIGED